MVGDRPIIEIRNEQPETSGEPPDLDWSDYTRVSYFENAEGGQLLFLYSEEENEVTVYQGDRGWEDPQTLDLDSLPNPAEGVYFITEPLLTQNERLWLESCLHALRHSEENGGE